ncbi:uncharacterized protein [Musca autumnalis]|uniref:uncharacterized protein n=1 Tax=Musca autumnalis TaxID=221902 RepID=UPI003CF20B95
MNFQDFIQHQRVLGEYIVSLYLELSKIAQKSVTRETREKLFKVGSSFTEARRDFLDNDRELRDMGKFPYEMHSIFASGVRYAIKKFDFLNRQVRIDFGIESKKYSLDTRILSRYKYIAEMDSLSPLEQYEKRNILRHSKTLKGGLIREFEYSLNALETEIRNEFLSVEDVKDRYDIAASVLMQYLNEFPKEDDLVENFNFLQICYRMVRFGKISRVAPKEVKVKDYEEINGKWFPKINTRQVDSNSIRKVENVTIPELKKIVKFTGSVGETTERKNENGRGDVSRKLESKINRLREENEKLESKLSKKTKDCRIAEEKTRFYESRAEDLSARFNAAYAEKEKAVEDFCEVQTELESLRKELDEARKRLKDESLLRMDLRKNIQVLRSELTQKDHNHLQEVNEIRTRHQVEICEVSSRLSEEYEFKLDQASQELREQYEVQMRDNRAEINIMKSRIVALESTNAELNSRNCNLAKLLANERRRHASDIAKVEAELQRCRDEMTQQLHEYQDPMDIKDSLDFEVAAYKKLVCGSEKDDIGISECEAKAKFLKVPNKGTDEVQVDGRRFKCKIAPVSQWYVSSATHEEEVAGADHIRHTIIRHMSSHHINDERFSGEKYPLRRKWIYHVFKQWKRSPHPSWLLKVLGAIT